MALVVKHLLWLWGPIPLQNSSSTGSWTDGSSKLQLLWWKLNLIFAMRWHQDKPHQ